MILQCNKCNLFFRSFAKMKHHKLGTLGEQCAGEERRFVDKPAEPENEPAGLPPIESAKQEKDAKPDETVSKAEDLANKSPAKSEDTTGTEADKKDIKSEHIAVKKELVGSDVTNVNIKEEPTDPDDVKVKLEPGEFPNSATIRRAAYADGIYKPAFVVLDSDSDEFEAESDESAPDDDDVETHLGLSRKLNFREVPKKRKRKKAIPANATVIYITNAAGQKIKKITMPKKESTRWVPPHPWVPYTTQVTVEQTCQFLEMTDYPIVMNEYLKEKFKDYEAFKEFARPLFEKVNPDAHPLTLMTLVKAKWFEVMNTVIELTVNGEEIKHETEDLVTKSREAAAPEVKRSVTKKIKLNWSF